MRKNKMSEIIVPTLDERIAKEVEKYACKFHQYPGFDNPHGCTDCYNQGYIFDNEEIVLILDLNKEIQRLKEIEAIYLGLCK